MGDQTGINWTDATWNPVVGCSIVSPGCKNCYAMGEAHRLGERIGQAKYAGLTELVKGKPVWNGIVRLHQPHLDQPLRWTKPRLIFVNSMSDLFHESLTLDQIVEVIAHIVAARVKRGHVLQILTKRTGRMADILCDQPLWERTIRPRAAILLGGEGPGNLRWMGAVNSYGPGCFNDGIFWGCTVEDQDRADARRRDMQRLPRHNYLTWVSNEPSVGPINWNGWGFLSGMVTGGESGPDARPMHPDWVKAASVWCCCERIPWDLKQWGEWLPATQHPPALAAQLDGNRFGADLDRNMLWRGDGWSNGVPMEGVPAHWVRRVGKKAAGRALDGVEHNGFTDFCRSFLRQEADHG